MTENERRAREVALELSVKFTLALPLGAPSHQQALITAETFYGFLTGETKDPA